MNVPRYYLLISKRASQCWHPYRRFLSAIPSRTATRLARTSMGLLTCLLLDTSLRGGTITSSGPNSSRIRFNVASSKRWFSFRCDAMVLKKQKKHEEFESTRSLSWFPKKQFLEKPLILHIIKYKCKYTLCEVEKKRGILFLLYRFK